MKRLARIIILIGAVAWSTAGSAGDPWIAETWRRPGGAVEKLAKVLVVGISPDQEARRRFEDKFVSNLRGQKVEGITSHSIVADLGEIPDPAKVADALLSQEVDGVITLHLDSADPDSGEWGGEAWNAELQSETLVREYVESTLAEPAPEGKHRVVDIGVWTMRTRSRVWAGRTDPHKISKLRKRSGEIVQELIHKLRFDGVI